MKGLFVKDKKNDDPKARWYATENTLVEHGLEENENLKEECKARLEVMK
jgi:hypothetical protein